MSTPGSRRSRTRVAVTGAAVVALAAAVAVGAWRRAPEHPSGLVILYGDSLAVESAGAFADALARTSDATVITRPVPGLALCDQLDTMRHDLALSPDVVVIEFVGNNVTPCIAGPAGRKLTGQALVDRYAADARTATELFARHGTRVVLVGGPVAPGLEGQPTTAIADAYRRIVNQWAGRALGRVRYSDAAAAVTGADGSFVTRLPCLADEDAARGCEGGTIRVRNPDRIHFCPTEVVKLACPTYSSGARRFGSEMARVARAALDPDD